MNKTPDHFSSQEINPPAPPFSGEIETEIRKGLASVPALGAPLPEVPDWDDFQTWVMSKARKFEDESKNLNCFALGLAGEAGEFADLIKKHLYHDRPSTAQEKAVELGDILFYVAGNASLWGIPMSLVVREVMNKLDSRYPNGFTPERAHAHRGNDGSTM
jgi:NTP pyrophosphatase (non-canonical NTP hydrolase)